MPNYDELKSELVEIAKIVAKFPESVKPQVYELLVNEFIGNTSFPSESNTPKKKKEHQTKTPKKKTKRKSRRKRKHRKESFNLMKDLNLSGDGKKISFRDFCKEKDPESKLSNIQFNALAVYYLKKIMEVPNVTSDHIYTCYANIRKRTPPKAFLQSIRDTSSKRYGYIDASNLDDIKIPHIGIIFVEHELPPKKDEAKKHK